MVKLEGYQTQEAVAKARPPARDAQSPRSARQAVPICPDMLAMVRGTGRCSMPSRVATLRQAQRVLGNRAVQRLVSSGDVKGAPPAARPSAHPTDAVTPAPEAVAATASQPPVSAPPVSVPPVSASGRAPPAAAAPAGAPAQAPAREAAGPGAPASAVSPDAGVAAEPSVDLSSGAAVLESLSSAPASRLGAAIASAKGALPALQAHEKQAAQNAVPVIDTPTGLPGGAAPHVAPSSAPPPGQAKAASGPRAGKAAASPAPTPKIAAPLPGTEVSVAAAEPTATGDGGGSWWSWLTDRLSNFFASLPTTDPAVSTSAGPRQHLVLQDDADPAQNEHERLAGGQSVQGGRAHADAATSGEFGENVIAPAVPRGKLRTAYRPTPPRPPAKGAARSPPGLPANERDAFDEHEAPWVAQHVAERHSSYQREQAAYDRAAKKARDDGARQLAEENERTRTGQIAMREAAKADVTGARQRWREENRKIETEFGDKASARRREVDREIGQKVDQTDRDADAAFDEAEKKAAAEKNNAESEAAAKKREEQAKPRSWWDRAKGAISDAFSAIRSAITSIFDRLRQAVKAIIDAVKQVVHTLIEAARSAIVSLISAFGEFVKGLVTIALAAFPEAAAKARAWIDARVAAATEAVNRAAKALERAVEAILDGIGAAIDAALDILQRALTAALDGLEELALLPLQAMDALARLVEWVAKKGKFVQAALDLEGRADSVIEAMKKSLGGMIAAAPSQAHAKLQQLAGSLVGGTAAVPAAPQAAPVVPGTTEVRRAPAPGAAPPVQRHVPASQHLKGVERHLEAGLTYLKDHWWDELKKVGWNLLWPWPAVWADLKAIWAEVKAGFDDAYHLRVGKVIDHVLAIDQKLNSIVGNLYGWFFIASVLIGAIIGAMAGGIGAIPGALAGAAVAGEAGEALVAALLATETAVIVKGVADLAIGNDTAAEDEADYDKIAGSTLTIGVTLAMMLLGEIAAKLAKSIWEGVAGVLKGEKAPEVKLDVDPAKPADDGPTQPQPMNVEKLVICRVCDIVPGVPEDLMAQRAKLSPEMRQFLDQRAAKFFPDPANPTPENFKALRGFMENTARRGGGDLEAGLRKLAPQPPPTGKPFGSAIGELPRLRQSAEQLIADIKDFANANPDNTTIPRLADPLQATLDGPVSDMENGRLEATPEQVKSVERTTKGGQGELDRAKAAPSGTSFSDKRFGPEIDQIRPDGTLYQTKSMRALRNPSRTFDETVAQIKLTLDIAQKNPVNGQPRPVIFEFPEGLSKDVAADLKAIQVNGQSATIVAPEVVVPPK